MIRRVLDKFLHKHQEEPDTQETPSLLEEIEEMFNSLDDNGVKILIGEDISDYGDCLCEEIQALRTDIKNECGFILPPINIKSKNNLQENEYEITANQKLLFNGFVIPTEDAIKEEIIESLRDCFEKHIAEFFSNEITEKYASAVQKNNGWLAWNVTGSIPITTLKAILIDILESKKSINNIVSIFEKINEEIFSKNTCAWTRDPHDISKEVLKNF